MPFRICVCIKQVPDPTYFDRISVDQKTGLINRAGIPTVTNSVDRHAIEEALQIRERIGGTVTVVTMGPPQAKRSLKDALAMGADMGALLCDAKFGGADTLATARTMSSGIQVLGGFDLVLCGNESADGATGHVPVQLAIILGVPWATNVRKIDILNEKMLQLERVMEGGFLRVKITLPAVISVTRGINIYRLPTVMGIIETAHKKIVQIGCDACEEIGICSAEMGGAGSPTKVIGMFESSHQRKIEMVEGEPSDAARNLVRKLWKSMAL